MMNLMRGWSGCRRGLTLAEATMIWIGLDNSSEDPAVALLLLIFLGDTKGAVTFG